MNMSHNVVASGDNNPLGKISVKSTLAFSNTDSSTAVAQSHTNPGNIITSDSGGTSQFKPSRLNLSLNFGQAGESAKKRTKIDNYIQETPGKYFINHYYLSSNPLNLNFSFFPFQNSQKSLPIQIPEQNIFFHHFLQLLT